VDWTGFKGERSADSCWLIKARLRAMLTGEPVLDRIDSLFRDDLHAAEMKATR
jgi:hypothetical protein